MFRRWYARPFPRPFLKRAPYRLDGAAPLSAATCRRGRKQSSSTPHLGCILALSRARGTAPYHVTNCSFLRPRVPPTQHLVWTSTTPKRCALFREERSPPLTVRPPSPSTR